MKSITFKFELVDRPTKDGKYPINLRITQSGKHKRKMSVIRVKSKKDFNKNASQENWIRPSEPNYKKWNQILADELSHVKNLYKEELNKGGVTPTMIIDKLNKNNTEHSLVKIIRERAEQIYLEGGIRNKKKYITIANHLEDFLKSKKMNDILISQFDTKFLSEFRTYLFTLPNQKDPDKKLHPNYISGMMSTLKAVTNHAILTLKVMKMDDNPFNGTKYCSEKKGKRIQLSNNEIELLEQTHFEINSLEWHSKNIFLFSYYMGGIRIGDLLQLKWCHIIDDNRLYFETDKADKIYKIKLHPLAFEIIKSYDRDNNELLDYIFPFLKNDAPYYFASNYKEKKTLPLNINAKRLRDTNSKNSLINKYLEKIRIKCGIETHITCHIARHSFGRKAKDNNVDTLHLKTIYQHSSLRETEGYMGGFPSSETDKVLAGIFDKSLSKKNNLNKIILGLNDVQLNKLIEFIEQEIITNPTDSLLISRVKMGI